MDFKLESIDFLVNINNRSDPYSTIKRCLMDSPYDHAFMYMGEVSVIVSPKQSTASFSHPMLFESNGQGCVIQSLSNRYGQEVVVMRLKPEYGRKIPIVLNEVVKLASPGHYYDYLCIVQFVLPRLICERLRLPLPLKYQRNPLMICSEAILEVCLRAGVPVLPKSVVPMPSDFVELSGILDEVQRGKLSPEWV